MTQKELNERIAMSLLTQCAWVWEHCTENPHEGEFKLTDICSGLYSRRRTDAKTGYVMVDMHRCQYWEHFADGIDGLKYFDCTTGEATLEFGDFRCSYWLTDVFKITSGFCRATGCSSLANKSVFGYKDGERYCRLPEGKVSPKSAPKREQSGTSSGYAEQGSTRPKVKSAQKSATRNIVITKERNNEKSGGPAPLSLADRLRAALRARLAA